MLTSAGKSAFRSAPGLLHLHLRNYIVEHVVLRLDSKPRGSSKPAKGKAHNSARQIKVFRMLLRPSRCPTPPSSAETSPGTYLNYLQPWIGHGAHLLRSPGCSIFWLWKTLVPILDLVQDFSALLTALGGETWGPKRTRWCGLTTGSPALQRCLGYSLLSISK